MIQLRTLQKNKKGFRPLLPTIIIGITTLIAFGVGVFALMSGINTIFQNLLYIPIAIACIYFTKRGFVFSVATALGYFMLVFLFPHDAKIIEDALIRVFIFILIAAIITFLASGRIKAEQALKESEAKGRRNSVLSQVTQDIGLNQIMNLLVQYTEEEDKTISGSILLFDPIRQILLPGTAPNLPKDYWALMESGLPLGRQVLGCGTAAYTRKLTITTDIENDPRWLPFNNFIEKAREHKIKACWSMPILSSSGALLGTFANYSYQLGEPTSENLENMKWAVEMAGIIIEKKHSEDELRESEAHFSVIFQANPAPIAITRLSDNRLIDTNAAWEQITGFTREEIIGHTPADLNIWVNPEQRNQMINELSASGKLRQEVQVRCKSGDIRDMLMSAEKIELAGQTYLLSMAQDITERRQTEKALQKSERHAHALISAIPDMIFTISSKGVFLDYKAAKEDLYLLPELFIGKNVSEVMPDWFAELALDSISKTISSGEIIVFEYALSIHGKQENHFECRMVPYSGEEVLAIVRNISERKEFERRFKESEANARAIMESTSDVFVLLDKDGNVIDCNEAHASRLKMTRNEILGKNVFDYLPEEIASTRKEMFAKVLETGTPSVGEDFRAGNWNEYVMNPVFNAEGQVDRVAVFSRDITEKKQFVDLLEHQNKILKEKNRIQNTLIANLPGFVYRCANDHNWTMAYISDACEPITGYSPDDFINNHKIAFNDIVHPDYQEPLREKWQELLRVKGVFREEYPIICANGEIRWVWEQGRGIFSENDELVFLEGFIEDITQRKQAEILIKNSEEKYRTLFENLSQGIFFQSADGKIIDTNDAALRMFGITRDQFLGKDSFDARWEVINENNETLPPDKHPSMVAILSGKPVISQTFGVFIPETGKYTWLIIDAIPQFRPGETRPYQVFASMQDITRRKMAEEALRISEDRLSKTIIAANDGSWDWDLITGRVYFDPRYYTMAGYEVNEFPHLLAEFQQRLHPEDIENVMNYAKSHLAGLTERFQHEFRFRRKDGQYMWILGRGVIVERDEKGTPLRFVGTHQDISELKQIKLIDDCRLHLLLFAETHTVNELLEETLNEVEKLTESKIGFYHFLEEDQVTVNLQNWSTQTKALYCKADSNGLRYHLIEAGVWTDCIKQRKPVIHNDYASLPNRKGLPEGHAEVIRELVVPVMRGKKITAILGLGNKSTNYTQQDVDIVVKMADLAWDITERKLSAEALKKSELFLKELNATKDKFFSIIAHDLKSPFNTIMGFSEILVEQVKDKDYDGIEKYANIILQSSEKTVSLLMNLMEWARSQTGRMEFIPEHFEMCDFISDIIAILNDIAAQKMITIKIALPPHAPVFADKAMISTVLRNLISNAIKFTKPGGLIVISASQKQTELVVSVSDNGVGIPREKMGKLFRIDENYTTPGTNNERGTGLGLILCKEFVEKHGGKIRVESIVENQMENKSGGSTFSFTIPGNPFSEVKQETKEKQTAAVTPQPTNTKPPDLKILIIEDHEHSELPTNQAAKLMSKEIFTVNTGITAIEACQKNPDIALILMDFNLPGMDGLETTRQIRQINSQVVIIAQSAFASQGFIKKAIEAGCNEFLTKPVNKDVLMGLTVKYFKV